MIRSVTTALALACSSTALISQSSIPVPELARHVMGRLGYGALPNEVLDIELAAPSQQLGLLNSWITAQLTTTQALPNDLTTVIASLGGTEPTLSASTATTHGWTRIELSNKRILMAAFSPNQLRERMANFWRTLFNTHYRISEGYFQGQNGLNLTLGSRIATHAEWGQFEEFRTNALGDFRDLLTVSINSVAMRVYLDLHRNKNTNAPNENYARELLELHTMGPTNAANQENYTAADILALARLLYGHGVTASGALETTNHSTAYPAPPTVLFASTPTPFQLDSSTSPPLSNDPTANASAFLDALAARAETKDYICRRLMRHFIRDDLDFAAPANAALLTACTAAWGTRGDIQAVLTTLFGSPVFFDNSSALRTLVRTPFETEIAQMRRLRNPATTLVWGPAMDNSLLLVRLRLDWMGQTLFQFPSPDGYPMANASHTDAAKARIRLQSALELGSALTASYQFSGDHNYVLNRLFGSDGFDSATSSEVATAFLSFFYPNNLTNQDILGGVDILERDSISGSISEWATVPPSVRRGRVINLNAYAAGLTQSVLR